MSKIKLAAARVNAGYTLTQVSEIIGKRIGTISNWETGKISPKMEDAQRLAELYKIDINDIEWGRG